ncbi:MAG: cryptochrome/photolyase family protein [Pseudomonadales bacterium]
MNDVLVIFGNQLFHPDLLRSAVPDRARCRIVLVEDPQLCRRYAYHKQKLVLVLAAMRQYAALLETRGYDVRYHSLDEATGWRAAVRQAAHERQAARLLHFEVESPDLSRALGQFAAREALVHRVLPSPMFLTSHDDFAEHLAAERTPKLLPFYKAQRRRLQVLVSAGGEPVGGRWSFDQLNRERLPRHMHPDEPPVLKHPAVVHEVKALVADQFATHPGGLRHFWVPTNHADAERWLDSFLATRFWNFGTYEDALTDRSAFVYHSALAPLLNIGLLTPRQVLDRTLDYAAGNAVPVNSVEGFVRQIIGWREFVRGVYHHYYQPMQSRNIWNADRKLTDSWYAGSTGLAPMDHVIGKALKLGWAHHIERLMVAANLMNLSGIQPQEVYRWFMEMFVDAYDWVMVPNVFGMGLTSEGGIFTSKPYICGSNYVLKMGDFKRGAWCDVMDGLLWRFVAHHERTLRANHRLAPMVANLARVARKRPEIFSLADEFIDTHTRAA